MNARFPTFYNERRRQRGQTLKPETGCLGFAMSELPRLDNLIWFPDATADNADRVFQCNARYRGIEEKPNEVQSVGLLLRLISKPPSPGYGQVLARRVGNHQVPTERK